MDESGMTSAFGNPTFASIVGQIIGYLNDVVFILGSVAIVVFLWGVVQYIFHAGAKPKRNTMLWSLLVLFVLFSIWGILGFMCNSFLSENLCSSSGASTSTGPANIVPAGGQYNGVSPEPVAPSPTDGLY